MFGLCNSLVEWYRPGGALRPETVVATVVRIVFEGAGIGLTAEGARVTIP